MRGSLSRATLLFGLALAASGVASMWDTGAAQAADEAVKKRARELFTKGAEAVQAGRAADGLPLLLEAESLFHAPTHVLFIARAQAALGKYLEADSTYKKLVEEPLGPKASKPFLEAQETGKAERAALSQKIPRLVVQVEPADLQGLEIRLDGSVLPVKLGEPVPVDKGSHTVTAVAPGYVDGKVTVEAHDSRTTAVRIQLSPVGKSGEVVAPPPSEEPGWSPMKTAGVPLMAVGGAAMLAGGALGIVSLLKKSDADDQFETCGRPCEAEITALDEDAALFGNVGIGVLAGGAAVLGTGVVLFVLGAGSEAPPTQSGSATLLFGPGFVGVERSF